MNKLACCVLALLLCVPLAARAQVDSRVLVLDNGRDKPLTLSVRQLVEALPALTLAVDDIEYGTAHSYVGLALSDVLNKGGFRPGEQLLLVCSDGYSIPFDSSVLQQGEWQGLLALRDEAATDGKYFVPFQHGGEMVDFAPFYLVWTPINDSATRLAARDLPWPYQLTEIRVQRPEDFASAQPSANEGDAVAAGFALYYQHCIKCHRVNGSGGTLGPALDSGNGLNDLLAQGDVRERIHQVSSFYPASKMPDFTDTLDDAALDALLAYMHWAARIPAL